VSLSILVVEIRRASGVKIEREEVARIARDLCRTGLLQRLRYNVDLQAYEPFDFDSEVGEVDWFEITGSGRMQLDRLAIEPGSVD
jgi:hypothetical protein